MADTLFHILLYIFEAFIILQYSTTIFQPRFRKKIEIPSVFICYAFLFAMSYYNNVFWINLLSILLVHLFIFWFIYKTKWYMALLHTVITTIIMASTELLVLSIITYFTNNVYSELSYFVIGSFLSKLLYFVVLYFISHIAKGKTNPTSKPAFNVIILIIVPIISVIISITLFSICLTIKLPLIQDILISISSVLILIINIIIFYHFDYSQKMNEDYTQMLIRLQKEIDTTEYYKLLQENNEHQRILIHDIKNHFSTIMQLNAEGQSEQLSKYISEIIKEPVMNESVRKCNNELLNIILNRYNNICIERGIELRTDIRNNSINFLTNKEITSLFANLLDNALEAISDSSGSYIEINISTVNESSYTVINIINTCTEAPHLDKHGNIITKKKDKHLHGLGMKSILYVVSQHHGNLRTEYAAQQKEFHTNIVLKNLPEK